MEFKITIHGDEELKFSSILPPEFSDYRVHGSNVFSTQRDFGTMVIQEIETPGATALICIFVCKYDTKVYIETPQAVLKMHLALRGNLQWEFKGIGSFAVSHNHANLYYLPVMGGTGEFKKGKRYIFFDVFYTKSFISPFVQQFDNLKVLLQNEVAAALSPVPILITAEMWRTVNPLIHDTDDDKDLLLFSNHLQHLLLRFLIQSTKSINTPLNEPPRDIEMLYRAELIIKKDLIHTPNMDQIAGQLLISKSKLIKDFKNLFGQPPIAYWRHWRMQKAGELLQTTRKSAREVAVMMGFESEHGFIDAFKKEFNMAPGEWRKKL